MTDIAEREAAAEMLLKAKGFTDVVVSVTDGTADVVLNMGDVTDAKRAQVEDIVRRKTNVAAENIIITSIQNSASAVPGDGSSAGDGTDAGAGAGTAESGADGTEGTDAGSAEGAAVTEE